jgi:hypothetical protein
MTLAAETDELDPELEAEHEEVVEQEAEGETPEEEGTDQPSDDATGDEVVVTIGEESPPSEEVERAPEWVRELRKSNREKDREIRELREQVKKAAPAPQAVVVGAEPTLEGCDYDEAKFKADWKAWNQRQADHAEQERKKAADIEAGNKAWQSKLDAYSKQKSELKVRDFEDAEEALLGILNTTQQGIIVSGADNAAVVNYALFKNPKKAKELASIADPVKFAFAIAKLETQLKVTPRKAAPLPETPVRGSGPVAGSQTLERLRAEADKTGDRTKVAAYMKQQKLKTATK